MLAINSDCMGNGQQEFVPSVQMVNQLLPGGFMSEGASPPKISKTVVEPQLVDLL
jgi:hypothetical protein